MEEPTANLISKTVLILEDDFLSVMLLEKSLQEAGYKTIHFANTDGALKWIEENTPDILLTDWSLAGVASAADVARALRTKNPGARVIFITGYNQEDIADKLTNLEPFDFFIKPFDFESIAHMLSLSSTAKN